MSDISSIYTLILEINELKKVLRNTTTFADRKESTAEHSWSVAMITLILINELKKEFPELDELKAIKLSLIHDVVEIYAGDVMAFDIEARKNKEAVENIAMEKVMQIYPQFGKQLHNLWHEFEKKETIEAKVAKASDAICPIFLRVHSGQSYIPFKILIADLEKTKYPHFIFSKTYSELYVRLKQDLIAKNLIAE